MIGNAAPPRCLWFSATLAGPPDLLDDRREPIEETRREVEPDVRYANIATTEGTGQPRWERRGRARLIAAVLPRRPYLGGWRRRTAQLGRGRRSVVARGAHRSLRILMRPHRSGFQLDTTVCVHVGEAIVYQM